MFTHPQLTEPNADVRLPWYADRNEKNLRERGLKLMKCSGCPEVFEVSHDAESCRCGTCTLHSRNEVREMDADEQLELGEVAL